jgi:hypothetical protein
MENFGPVRLYRTMSGELANRRSNNSVPPEWLHKNGVRKYFEKAKMDKNPDDKGTGKVL